MRSSTPLVLLSIFVAVVASCGTSSETVQATHSERGVRVEIEITMSDATTGVVEATFIPETEGFHLYSTEMPADGIEGFGRPTLLHIETGAVVDGPTLASEASTLLPIDSLGIDVPVYPNGPVTLKAFFASAEEHVELRLTYMSCGTDGGCTIPVIDRPVIVELP